MSKPVKIGVVARTITPAKFVQLAEQADRLARCRQREIQAEQADQIKAERKRQQEQVEIIRLGRPEYLYLKNAQWKEKRYARNRKTLAETAEIRQRALMRQQEKADALIFEVPSFN